MLKVNKKEKLELILSHFQFFKSPTDHKNLARNRYGLIKVAKPYW